MRPLGCQHPCWLPLRPKGHKCQRADSNSQGVRGCYTPYVQGWWGYLHSRACRGLGLPPSLSADPIPLQTRPLRKPHHPLPVASATRPHPLSVALSPIKNTNVVLPNCALMGASQHPCWLPLRPKGHICRGALLAGTFERCPPRPHPSGQPPFIMF